MMMMMFQWHRERESRGRGTELFIVCNILSCVYRSIQSVSQSVVGEIAVTWSTLLEARLMPAYLR